MLNALRPLLLLAALAVATPVLAQEAPVAPAATAPIEIRSQREDAGELVSKADLTEHIYQQDFDRDSNVLEVFIGRLRKKLDPEGEIKPIETVRGRGYRFAIPRDE